MSRHRRRREESASHWEPEYRRSYSDDYSRQHYGPTADLRPRNRFNYWREDVATSTSYYPQRSYGRDGYNDRWREGDSDHRSCHADSEPSYSRRRRDFGPGRDWDDRESWRSIDGDRKPPHRDASRQRHSIYTPPITQPTVRARSPIESIPSPLPTSSQPLKPIGYLSLSEQPSEILRDPTASRKLLVLDLNGTLLIRSARSRAVSGSQLRPVQPRPYMQSFRDYLFCLETKAWLDTMVWSSAQPHSVDNMVDRVFGVAKGELKAVWNRKSLGLSKEDYHRKAVTTKDLTKPWDLFSSALSPEKHQGPSSGSPQSQTTHSALTTVLLDDSPHKAVLQPYNHVCIPEYDSARRQHDLRSFLATKEPKRNGKDKQQNQVEIPAHPTEQTISRLPAIDIEKEPYDMILLAVIGILETVKLQSNAAGWIRGGGLWAVRERGVEGGTLGVEYHSVIKTEDSKNDASSISKSIVTSEQASPQTKVWFEDSSVVAFWVARGRRALVELDIRAAHGVTG